MASVPPYHGILRSARYGCRNLHEEPCSTITHGQFFRNRFIRGSCGHDDPLSEAAAILWDRRIVYAQALGRCLSSCLVKSALPMPLPTGDLRDEWVGIFNHWGFRHSRQVRMRREIVEKGLLALGRSPPLRTGSASTPFGRSWQNLISGG